MSASSQCSTSPVAASAPVWQACARPQPVCGARTIVQFAGRSAGSTSGGVDPSSTTTTSVRLAG